MDIVARLANITNHHSTDPIAVAVIEEAIEEIQYFRRMDLIRRLGSQNAPEIDMESRTILDRNGKLWRPTQQQWLILSMLLRHAGKIVPFSTLIDYMYSGVRDGGPNGPSNVLTVQIGFIRRRSPWKIHTYKGEGYLLEGFISSR